MVGVRSQKTTNHNALNIHSSLRPFYSRTVEIYMTKSSNQRMWDRPPTLNERRVPEEFAAVHTETSEVSRPCSMFHADSDGDESTGREPCHQAFLVGMGRGSRQMRTDDVYVLQVMNGWVGMYAQFSTRNGHGGWVNQVWTEREPIFH